MTNEKAAALRRYFGIIHSISILLAGLCLMLACAGIYFSGEGYSRDAVAAAFSSVSLPVFLCLILTGVSFPLKWRYPLPGESPRPAGKQAQKRSAADTADVPPQKATYLLLAAGIVLALCGLFTGGTADVLAKAVNICTECIGLG